MKEGFVTEPALSVLVETQPRLAVVIPVFRHSVLLAEAVESVLSQEADFAIRLIIVNDGCPHRETEAVCLDYARSYPDRITCLRKPNGGLSQARNHGIRFALSQLPGVEAIYFLDADNALRPKALARAMAVLEAGGADWVYPNIDMFGMTWGADYGGAYSRLLHSRMNTCEAGSLVHRRVFEAGVMFDESFLLGFEDWEFFLSAGAAGFSGRNLEDFGFRYRKRPESMLADSERVGAEILSVMQRKHSSLFSPRSLMTLEQRELPRYAIFLSDLGCVRLTSDPALPGEEISIEEYELRYWRAQSRGAHYAVPPLLVVASAAELGVIAKAGMLHWAFWRSELLCEKSGTALLGIGAGQAGRLGFADLEATPDLVKNTSMIMMRRDMLATALCEADLTEIENLALGVASPCLQVFQVELTPEPCNPERVLPREAVLQLLRLTRRLIGSIWRSGALQTVEWRASDVAPGRLDSHNILRSSFQGVAAYPRVAERPGASGRNIGILLPQVEFGGVEKVALNIAAEFKAAGHALHLFILQAQSAAVTKEWLDVVESVSFFAHPDFEPWAPGGRNYFGTNLPRWTEDGDHSTSAAMLYWLDGVIDFHGGPFSSVVGRLRKLGLRTASSVHVPDVSPVGRPQGHPYLSLAYEHAFDVFAPCSERLGDWLHAMGVPDDKIIPVPNGPGFTIAPQVLAECLQARSERDDQAPLRVLFLGRLDPQKGLGRLAQVVDRSSALNLAWRVIGKPVISRPGETLLPEVLTPLLEPPLTTPEALAAAYAQADVLVLLSGYEGLPLTILEAMRQGVVVLATDVGAVSEVVRHGDNGFLLPLDTAVSSCLEALTLLSSDRQMLHRLSQRAVLDMEGRDWARASARLIERLTGSGGAPRST